MRLSIICGKGLDNFLDWAKYLKDYEVKIFVVQTAQEVHEAIEWGEIVWIEWMNQVAQIATEYPNIAYRHVLMRCHSYEALAEFSKVVAWPKVHKTIFVADHVKSLVEAQVTQEINSVLIPNGIDIEKYPFKEKTELKKVAFIGNISHKKGPMLLLQCASEFAKRSIATHVAGSFQDKRFGTYLNHMIKEMKLKDFLKFDGFMEDIPGWLQDKDAILCTSPWEGHPVGVLEGMACGLCPAVHNFPGSREIYGNDFMLWNSIDELVNYNYLSQGQSKKARLYAEKFTIQKQVAAIDKAIKEVVNANTK